MNSNSHKNNNKVDHPGCVVCFNNLGIDSRMEIYKFLREKGKKPVSEIVKVVGLTQPTVSYHLKSMRESGILLSERSGKEVYYYINETCPVHGHACVLRDIKFPCSE